MSDTPEDLNYDCNFNMFLVRTQMSQLPHDERSRVISWMRKLATCNRNVEEMRLRNDFLYLLVLNVQRGELRTPFDVNPPSGPLPEIDKVVPGADLEELDEKKRERPFMDEMPPDDATFLTARPAARCGAFCYLAVLCNTKEKPK